jgi:hypothetical protein
VRYSTRGLKRTSMKPTGLLIPTTLMDQEKPRTPIEEGMTA